MTEKHKGAHHHKGRKMLDRSGYPTSTIPMSQHPGYDGSAPVLEQPAPMPLPATQPTMENP